MGLKLNGSYISLLLAVQIGKWTAKFRVESRAPRAGCACGITRSAGITGITPLCAPAFPSPRQPRLPQGRRGKASGFLVSRTPLLFFVLPKRCMLARTSLFISPSAAFFFFSLLFSRSPRMVAFVSGFRMSPSFPSLPLRSLPLRNSPPRPEGQRNKNWHKMSCERSSWKVFLQKIRGTREGLPLGTRTFSHSQSTLKPKKTHR